MTSALFKPIRLRELTLENRIVVSPMCQYSAVDGNAGDWHLIHLGHLALGGAGLLILEATAVDPVGRITPDCLGLWSDANEAALRGVLAIVRRHSPIPLAIQLAHAGRKASSRRPWDGGGQLALEAGGWECVAPSSAPHVDGDLAPRSLSTSELPRLAEAFVRSAERAARLGFEAIELHAAHGYLLHQFLSPIANRRDDAYGGSLERRMRFPLEVVAAVRDSWPADRPLGVRVSATDWVEGGGDIDHTLAFAEELRRLGVDWIDASSGGISPLQTVAVGPGYQVELAAAIRSSSGVPTIAVGLITEPRQAQEIVASGQADMVALARGILSDPRWAWHAAAELGATAYAPPQYLRAAPMSSPGGHRRL
ncbi:MAG: NADH:flavin oxidoreductase/NADH oxidase [Thermoleophilia bacterium]|nr:NADH:flavin oxidoreductase/NADH oxidase [Thermoleophilia bacterium]